MSKHRPVGERIRALQEKQQRHADRAATAAAELQRLHGRAQHTQRQREDRRKILVGALMYESIRRGTLTMAVLKAGLNDYLDKDWDRALFDLPARQGPDGQSTAGGGARLAGPAGLTKDKPRNPHDSQKEDTRRKILIGALIFDLIKNGEWEEAALLRQLDGYLGRERDRALFDLPARTQEAQQVGESDASEDRRQ